MFKKIYTALSIVVFLSVLNPLFGRKGLMEEFTTPEEISAEPWFTGPLLTPSANVVPVGYINVEPYVFGTTTFAHYNEDWKSRSDEHNTYSINPLLSLQIGLTERIDVQLSPQFAWSYKNGQSATRLGDLPTSLDFQILPDEEDVWWPAIKFAFRETLPIGKYQNLNPALLGTDATGLGSFMTGFGLTFGKLFHFSGAHYLNTRLAIGYFVPARVRVHGYNSYGGGAGTVGYVYPGNDFTASLGLEFSMTRHWVLALDVLNLYHNRTRFSGTKGVTSTGAPATVGGPSRNQIGLAPAIEYNWSEKLGLIAGCWFTVAGRNAGDFASAVIALNYFTPIRGKSHDPAFSYPGGGND